MLTLARLFVVVCGGLMIIFGVWLATYGDEGDVGLVIVGLVTALIGAIGIGVLAVERMRYRSAVAETPESYGSPGGETPGAPLEARFVSTSEVFVDPSSGKTMRVFSDPSTGERRYQVDA
jgi:hypothetical protein